MALTQTLAVTSSTTSLTTNIGATDRETVVLYLVSTGAVISSALYTITGYSNTNPGSLVIVFDDWTDYVGESIKVMIYTDIDAGDITASMLVDFSTALNISPATMQAEMYHLYYIIRQFTGGSALGSVSLSDLVTLITRLNDLADDLFTMTTNAGTPAIWDGLNTLNIGGDTNVQAILTTHESRLDTAESEINTAQADIITAQATADGAVSVNVTQTAAIASIQSQITSDVGLPTPVASGQAAAADSASPIQVLAVDTLGALDYIDLLAQVKNAPITDAGGYFPTDVLIDILQYLGARATSAAVVWVAGGYFTIADQGGVDPAAAATQLNDPAANTTPIRTGNMDGGTAAHATNWIMMSDTNANDRCVLFIPTGLLSAGYLAADFELSLTKCVDNATGEIAAVLDVATQQRLIAKSDGTAFYLNATGQDTAITIKRVRTI